MKLCGEIGGWMNLFKQYFLNRIMIVIKIKVIYLEDIFEDGNKHLVGSIIKLEKVLFCEYLWGYYFLYVGKFVLIF